MTYADLINQLKTLPLEEVRNNSQQFFEFVIRVDRISELSSILEKYFSSPLKPAGENPSKEIEQLVAGYGGIRGNQTLYRLEEEKSAYYTMLWPWENGILVTAKVFQVERRD